MKKLLKYIAVCLLISGCSEEFDGDPQKMYATKTPHFLRAGTEKLSVNNNNTPCKLSVASLDIPWVIENDIAWLTVTPDKGTSATDVSIVAEPNLSIKESRTGIIYLKSESTNWPYECKITISQPAAEPVVQFSKTSIELSEKGNTDTLLLTANGEWTATADDWITLSSKSGEGNSTIIVTAEENITNDTKTGKITVSMGGKTANVDVTQKGKFFAISDSTLSYTSIGGDFDLQLSTNDTWTAKIEDGISWITLSQESGSGSITLKATAADNPSTESRTANIVFETKYSQSKTVIVTQDARFLDISTSEQMFKGKGGTSDAITISTDGQYSITCSDTWFTINQNENTFTITASVNDTPDPRTGTITIELTDLIDGKLSKNIDVMQYNTGSSLFRNDYDEDSHYDQNHKTSGNISKDDYATEKDYDNTSNADSEITKNDYATDKDYDNTSNADSDISKTDYKTDNNLDEQHKTSSDIQKSGYNTDENYNDYE